MSFHRRTKGATHATDRTVHPHEERLFGRIRTLALDLEIVLVPAEHSDAENAPDYRAHLGGGDGPEVGAGWKRTGEKAGDYVSVQIDDPMLAQPIRANLFQSGDDKAAWGLHWARPQKRADRD